MVEFSPEVIFKFTNMSLQIIGFWVPSSSAGKRKVLLYDLYWWTSTMNNLLLILALLNAIYEYQDQRTIMIQTTCILAGVIELSVTMIVYKRYRSKLQYTMLEIINFMKHANANERTILQDFVNKYAIYHLIMIIGYYVTCIGFVITPIVLPQPFPSFAKYPFNVDSLPMHQLVYLHQAIVGLQSVAGAGADCQVAVFLWFTAARFKMLTVELSNVKDEYDLRLCINKHIFLLRFANNLITSVRYVILTTVANTALLMIFGCLQFILADSMVQRYQFLALVIVASNSLFLCSYPAENLITMSSEIGTAAYNSLWIGRSSKITSSVRLILQRSQRPVMITINGLLPSLSLRYYASFLYSSLSYFTTLRAVLHNV